jgi:hypothetical protein
MSRAGDLSVLEAALTPDAKWRAIEDGPWRCENREMILAVIKRNLAGGLLRRIEETTQVGKRDRRGVPSRSNPERTDGRWITASPMSSSRCTRGAWLR